MLRKMFGEARQKLPTIAPMMPVERHIDATVRQQFEQRAVTQLVAHLQLGRQPQPIPASIIRMKPSEDGHK